MSKFKSVEEVMLKHFGNLKADRKLTKQLRAFRFDWIQKDPIYAEFLGSNLFGVHEIRFSRMDDDNLFVESLGVSHIDIDNDVKDTKGIEPSYQVSSNGILQSLIFLMHLYTVSKLSDKDKHEGIYEVYNIFAYKVISSLYYGYFDYQVTEPIAKTVYEKLSNKFLLKKLGSWQNVFDYRTKDVLPKGLHYDKLKSYTTDDCVRMANDLQGRIRELVKNIYGVLVAVTKEKDYIKTSSTTQEGDDGAETKDVIERPEKYLTYARSIYSAEYDFVDYDIVYLLGDISKNLDTNEFVKTLKYLSNEVIIRPDDKDDFISVSILQTIKYINEKNISHDYAGNIYNIINMMKGYWSSSSVKDKEVKHVKKLLYNITHKATGKKTKWLLVTISINILIYIFVRAVTKR